ncbi:MAG: hypothetical protein ABF649_17640 [Bacillus sp. (in: firmicutes)]
MIKKQMQRYIDNQENKLQTGKYAFLPEEGTYIEKQSLLEKTEISIAELSERFQPIYIEIAHKESDDSIQENIDNSFLSEKISYLEKNLDHYLYMETAAFDIIRIDALTIEVDSVFRTYEVMFGLHLPKKLEKSIRSYFDQALVEKELTYNLLFNNQEGLWEVNFPIEGLSTFSKEIKVFEALQLIYLFLFRMEEKIEAEQTID